VLVYDNQEKLYASYEKKGKYPMHMAHPVHICTYAILTLHQRS
jgi:hypothetical protein